MSKPAAAQVLYPGDPKCQHYENISRDGLGICKFCGRKKQYPNNAISDQTFTAQSFSPLIQDGRPHYRNGEPI